MSKGVGDVGESNPHIGWYAAEIQRIANCSTREAELLEEIMRLHIYHSTLDWVRPEQFRAGALEALAILNEFQEAGDTPDSWRRFLAGERVNI